MSSLGTSRGYHGLRYRNKICKCGEICAIKISCTKPENGGRLYYTCANDTCNMFGWCLPYKSTGSSILANYWIDESIPTSNNKEDGVSTIEDDEEVVTIIESMCKLEQSVSSMKKLVGTSMIMGCLLVTMELVLFRKRLI
ncbi:hypothetical protein M9H77_12699 [Catharanthus roseus]|uniref:Uncharacterized protein n=1 Tax=Catharanthus roseus TaxID=4058 RepID=A0ACC0BI29_CATRO|nr:hypothetical protein M9H77_12699 [Catharanthus roseus]